MATDHHYHNPKGQHADDCKGRRRDAALACWARVLSPRKPGRATRRDASSYDTVVGHGKIHRNTENSTSCTGPRRCCRSSVLGDEVRILVPRKSSALQPGHYLSRHRRRLQLTGVRRGS